MPNVVWQIEGIEFGNCNCDYSCPCQFEARPTHGNCRGFEVIRIDKGHFGAVALDGLNVALIYGWPGAIYEGNGEMQAIIDERATPDQRNALRTVLYGGETDEAKTHWWVYHAMSRTVHDPLFKPIDFEVDLEARTARVVIADLLQARAQPIKSPATGQDHRVRIELPGGIEFEVAEIGSGSTTSAGLIPLDLKDTYGQFNIIRHSGTGIIRSQI
jgi:hypothetical protein